MPVHLNSFDALCECFPCAYCLLRPHRRGKNEFLSRVTKYRRCYFVTPQRRYFSCYELGYLCEGEKLIHIGENRYALPTTGTFEMTYTTPDIEARKHNLHLEANFLRWFNLERYDLMIKKQRYDNTKFGIGLFARSSIPKDTPLGFYPGDRIDAIELRKRSSERIEEDRYVFTLSPNEFIDGTHERRRLLIFANDSVPKDANCKACRVETLEDTTRPCIITKRDIAKGEEITYSYGDYAYEWRVKKSESATGVEIETPPAPPEPKKKYHTGADHKFTPKLGNKVGEHIPPLEDRSKIVKVMLEPLNLPETIFLTDRAARGCSARRTRECCLCNRRFTSLMRHNCKGLARDGGIKARRILKFCPICPNFDVLVEDLPGHLRRGHHLDSELSLKISKRYRHVLLEYKSGRLLESGYWDVFPRENNGGSSDDISPESMDNQPNGENANQSLAQISRPLSSDLFDDSDHEGDDLMSHARLDPFKKLKAMSREDFNQ